MLCVCQKKNKTRGTQSSEYRSVKIATLIGVVLAIYGISQDSDLSDLGILIGIVVSPLSLFYPAARSIVKSTKGEQDVQILKEVEKEPKRSP